MLTKALAGFRYPAEAVALAALMFFLPLLEAPKNIAWGAYALIWIANRFRTRDFGGRWDGWDTLILCWIGSGYVVAAFAGLKGSEWGGANDLLRYGSVLWLIKRAGYGPAEFRLVIGTLLVSALAGLPHAYWRLYVTQSREWFEINSVGQVNHTAIYLAIILGMALSAALAYWRTWTRVARLLAIFALTAIGASLLVTASRAAIGMAVVLVLVLTGASYRRFKVAFIAAVSIVLVVGALAWTMKLQVVRKQAEGVERQDILAYRGLIWNNAAAAWERYPLFGLGMDNFSRITLDRVREWRAAAGKPFDPAQHWMREWKGSSHAHSLWYNTLAERGVFGLSALAAVLIAWLASLLRHRPRGQDDDLKWALWGGALSAWVISVGAGLVNTSLHHEHGILSVTLLGIWLAWLRTRNGP